MVDMEAVRQFNSELSTIYETKPPISKGKVASITRLAVKAIKYYKHVVQSVEKFTQKCRQEYKVPALYIIDSIIRQSRHQFGADKDVFGPRFAKSITLTFQHLYKCPPEDQCRIVKVLNLWQRSGVYPPEVVQPLLNMAQQQQNEEPSQITSSSSSSALNQGNENQPSEAMPGNGTTVLTALQQQQQQHLEQIENLRRQLQEQQSINQQQQQQLIVQQMTGISNPTAMSKPMTIDQTLPFGNVQIPQGGTQMQANILHPPHQEVLQPSQAGVPPELGGTQNAGDDQPRFQLQPHVLAQIQALTGMNIRLPQALPNEGEVQDTPASNQQPPPNLGPDAGATPLGQGVLDQGSAWGHPSLAPLGRPPEQTPQQPPQKDQAVIDDFDYGDEQDDATRLAEQRRRLMEEERRLSQDQMKTERDRHHQDRSPGHRRRSQSPYRRNRSPKRKSRSPRHRSRSPRSRDRGRDRDRDRERGRDRDRDRDRGKDRERDRDQEEVEEGPENKGLPPVEPNACSVCSNTIWVGHLAKTVQQEHLQEIFAEFGEVTSIDMVPPRGCAYVQMSKRDDANKAVSRLSNLRLHGNFVKLAWAPAKGVKDRKYKEYFNVNLGVTYIPWEVLGSAPDLLTIAEGGWIDPESLPAELQNSLKQAEAGETKGDEKMEAKEGEQANQLPAGVLPPQMPPHLPPPGHPMFPPPMMPPHMMMRPPFPGGPHNPNMMPPDRPPWGMNVPGAPPPGFGPGVPPPQGMRPPGGGQFPHHQLGEGHPPFQPRLPMGMPPQGQEPGGMPTFRHRFHPEGPHPRGPMEFNRPPRMGEGHPRDFDGPPPHRGFNGPPPRGPNGPPPRGPEGMIPRGLDGPAGGMDGPQRGRDMPPQGLEGPHRAAEGPHGMEEVPPRGPEGPPNRQDGHTQGAEGPPRLEGPHQGAEGPSGPPQRHQEGPPRGPEGPTTRFEKPHTGLEGPPMISDHMPGGPMRPPFRGMNGPPGPNGPPSRGPEGFPREPNFRQEFRPDFRGGPHGPPPRHWGPPQERPPHERPPHERSIGMPPMRMQQPEWLRGPPPPERIQEERTSTDTSLSNEQLSGPKDERPDQRPEQPDQQPERPDNQSGDGQDDNDRGQRFRRDRDRNERPPWERERDRRRDRDRPRSGERERDRPRSRERERDSDRDRSRDRETSRDSDRHREISRDRERNRSRDRETSRDRDRDRRDRDRDSRDRRDRDRDRGRRDRDRQRSLSDRDSRKSSDSDNKYDRQNKSEQSKEIPTTSESKDNLVTATGPSEQPKDLDQSKNETPNAKDPPMEPVIHNNKISEPEEGEVIEDENNSIITSAHENKQVELQNEAVIDTKIKIEELKAAVEDPLKTTEDQKSSIDIAKNNTEEMNTAEMNIEIKQETNSEQIVTT